MNISIEFDTPFERRNTHQKIRRATRNISWNTTLLQVLYILEHGEVRDDMTGFNNAEKRDLKATTVMFEFDDEMLDEYVEILESATKDDFTGETTYTERLVDDLSIVANKLNSKSVTACS